MKSFRTFVFVLSLLYIPNLFADSNTICTPYRAKLSSVLDELAYGMPDSLVLEHETIFNRDPSIKIGSFVDRNNWPKWLVQGTVDLNNPNVSTFRRRKVLFPSLVVNRQIAGFWFLGEGQEGRVYRVLLEGGSSFLVKQYTRDMFYHTRIGNSHLLSKYKKKIDAARGSDPNLNNVFVADILEDKGHFSIIKDHGYGVPADKYLAKISGRAKRFDFMRYLYGKLESVRKALFPNKVEGDFRFSIIFCTYNNNGNEKSYELNTMSDLDMLEAKSEKGEIENIWIGIISQSNLAHEAMIPSNLGAEFSMEASIVLRNILIHANGSIEIYDPR